MFRKQALSLLLLCSAIATTYESQAQTHNVGPSYIKLAGKSVYNLSKIAVGCASIYVSVEMLKHNIGSGSVIQAVKNNKRYATLLATPAVAGILAIGEGIKELIHVAHAVYTHQKR